MKNLRCLGRDEFWGEIRRLTRLEYNGQYADKTMKIKDLLERKPVAGPLKKRAGQAC